MEEFNDKKRWHFCLYDRHKKDFLSVDADEEVVRGGDDGRHIFHIGCSFLSFKEIVTHRLADDALPVLLQEYVPRRIYKKQAVDHFLLEDRCTGISIKLNYFVL